MVWGWSEGEESKHKATTLVQVIDGCVLELCGRNEDKNKKNG